MADEFERIMAFFHLSLKEKEERIQELFDDSCAYFERFKHVIKEGSAEQKKEAIERVVILRNRIEEEAKQIFAKTGMSEQELTEFANNPKNFSASQWEAMEKARQQLKEGVEGAPKMPKKRSNQEQKQKVKKKRRKPKHWIPS